MAITDRAKRYRAQQNAPPGRKICNFCAARENIDIDHITGDESDGEPENLMYLCRPCNTTKGIVQSRNRVGIRTRQYNPAKGARSLRQFQNCAAVLLGEPGNVAEATAQLRATPPERRADYAEQIAGKNPFKSEAQRRKFYALLGRGEITKQQLQHFARHNPLGLLTIAPQAKNPPTYGQYVHGVTIHRRGAYDEGGEIIHATPANLRHRYALQIARTKRTKVNPT